MFPSGQWNEFINYAFNYHHYIKSGGYYFKIYIDESMFIDNFDHNFVQLGSIRNQNTDFTEPKICTGEAYITGSSGSYQYGINIRVASDSDSTNLIDPIKAARTGTKTGMGIVDPIGITWMKYGNNLGTGPQSGEWAALGFSSMADITTRESNFINQICSSECSVSNCQNIHKYKFTTAKTPAPVFIC